MNQVNCRTNKGSLVNARLLTSGKSNLNQTVDSFSDNDVFMKGLTYQRCIEMLPRNAMLNFARTRANIPDPHHETWVYAAVQLNNYDVCKSLLELGCDPDLTFTGTDPLELCIDKPCENVQLLSLLCSFSKLQPNEIRPSGNPLLFRAIEFKRLRMVHFLFEQGAELSDINDDCETAKEVAILVGGEDYLNSIVTLYESCKSKRDLAQLKLMMSTEDKARNRSSLH